MFILHLVVQSFPFQEAPACNATAARNLEKNERNYVPNSIEAHYPFCVHLSSSHTFNDRVTEPFTCFGIDARCSIDLSCLLQKNHIVNVLFEVR